MMFSVHLQYANTVKLMEMHDKNTVKKDSYVLTNREVDLTVIRSGK